MSAKMQLLVGPPELQGLQGRFGLLGFVNVFIFVYVLCVRACA